MSTTKSPGVCLALHVLIPVLAGLVGCKGSSSSDPSPPPLTRTQGIPAFAVAVQSNRNTAAVGRTFELSATVHGGGTTSNRYTWSFGDGRSASGPTTQVSFAQAGFYPVTVTVVDDKGGSEIGGTVLHVFSSTGAGGGGAAHPGAPEAQRGCPHRGAHQGRLDRQGDGQGHAGRAGYPGETDPVYLDHAECRGLGPDPVSRRGGGRENFGRERVSGARGDRYRFRTASLLNVALTAPYGHAGQPGNLSASVRHYTNPTQRLRGYNIFANVTDPDLTGTLVANQNQILANLDRRVRGNRQFNVDEVIAFLGALTADSAVDMRALIPTGQGGEDQGQREQDGDRATNSE